MSHRFLSHYIRKLVGGFISHLKNITVVKFDHFPKDRGESKTYLKPPASKGRPTPHHFIPATVERNVEVPWPTPLLGKSLGRDPPFLISKFVRPRPVFFFLAVSNHMFSSWWFQPIWKILVKMGIFPRSGWKSKIFETTNQFYIIIDPIKYPVVVTCRLFFLHVR